MKRIAIGIVLVLATGFGCASNSPEDLARFLPSPEGIDGWRAVDTVATYAGQNLFLLINGGAELYHKHGFLQVVSQTFEDSTGHQISLECYEMNSGDGARTIYESKISQDGESLPIGDAATLNSYYLNFYRDNYLVTLVGYDSDPVTVEGLKRLAELMSQKIDD